VNVKVKAIYNANAIQASIQWDSQSPWQGTCERVYPSVQWDSHSLWHGKCELIWHGFDERMHASRLDPCLSVCLSVCQWVSTQSFPKHTPGAFLLARFAYLTSAATIAWLPPFGNSKQLPGLYHSLNLPKRSPSASRCGHKEQAFWTSTPTCRPPTAAVQTAHTATSHAAAARGGQPCQARPLDCMLP
jgi:hypothetical protein